MRQRALVVPDKAERVYRFHLQTLQALKELTQAAGLEHPNRFSMAHLVRRVGKSEVRLLSSLMPPLKTGQLLAAQAGEADWPHEVYRMYWPLASAASFSPAA